MKFTDIWYTNHPLRLILAPLSGIYCLLVRLRQFAYRRGVLPTQRIAVPVIVVGNLTVGGTGKTPLVIWLAQFLKHHGYHPGIVSRGYGGEAKSWPQQVRPDSDAQVVGDEAILLARHSGCPVAVAPKRLLAVNAILDHYQCDLIISDDGLQHYALQRDIEIAVLDDIRRYGNRWCLPAGPLREPLSRLRKIDFFITKGAALNHEFSMQYAGQQLRRVIDDSVSQPLALLRGQSVYAVAGIGHPARFFKRLEDSGLQVHPYAFPDHHHYTAQELTFKERWPVIMTEKDAVKCRHLADERFWYLPIEAKLPNIFGKRLLNRLKEVHHG